MPKKPRVRARANAARPAIAANTGKRIHQCMLCGALVDPIFGAGNGSWCPSCGASDDIVWAAGKIPDPIWYGMWCEEQRKKSAAAPPPALSTPPSISVSTTPGGPTVKHAKTHTGTYSCLDCCVEYDIVGETHLKCDECGAPLMRGTLEELGEDDDGEEPGNNAV
jgi:hypothetical protein